MMERDDFVIALHVLRVSAASARANLTAAQSRTKRLEAVARHAFDLFIGVDGRAPWLPIGTMEMLGNISEALDECVLVRAADVADVETIKQALGLVIGHVTRLLEQLDALAIGRERRRPL